MHFLDEISITVRSGNGGNGKKSFLREKSRPFGGPDGGDGGRGGSVWFEADPNLNTFYPLKQRKRYVAQDGENGGSNNCTGKSGEDCLIKVPVGTQVRLHGSSEVLVDLAAPGARHKIAKGGRGGKGNQHFATPTNQAPQQADPGEPGEEFALDLELKLLADVGLIGLPNAGKSTFLACVSAARPKIADYPFTTLVPNLGVVTGQNYRSFVIADIPGLIEGAHQGHGLGAQFLRHVDRTRLLIHLVDAGPLAPEPPVQAAETIMRELAAYSPELTTRPRILCATRADLGIAPATEAELKEYAAREGIPFFIISAPTGQGLKPVLDAVWQGLANPDSLRREPLAPPRAVLRLVPPPKPAPGKKLKPARKEKAEAPEPEPLSIAKQKKAAFEKKQAAEKKRALARVKEAASQRDAAKRKSAGKKSSSKKRKGAAPKRTAGAAPRRLRASSRKSRPAKRRGK